MKEDQCAKGRLGGVAALAATRPDARSVSVNDFQFWGSVRDKKTDHAEKPEGAKPVEIGFRFHTSYFVPVAFAAKDWKVSARRIRFLLAAGRLAGQLKENGFWEVLYPYQFRFGTRGPSLKRQERPKKPERRAE